MEIPKSPTTRGCLRFVLEAIRNVAQDDRRRPVYVVNNDTLVESPVSQDFVDRLLTKVEESLEGLDFRLRVVRTHPNRTFRWCTDRMKIRPTSRFIREIVAESEGRSLVLERDGSAKRIGVPVAFIETAWRRYTKHSRNKAQEIQGAILPLVDTHQTSAPFIGAILAGVLMEGALTQLKSHGFAVVYFSYETIKKAFRRVGIDAEFHENTPDSAVAEKVRSWQALPDGKGKAVARELVKAGKDQLKEFMDRLERAIARQIESILVMPLHGTQRDLNSVDEAIEFIKRYSESCESLPLVHYYIQIRYNNEDRIEGSSRTKRRRSNSLNDIRRYWLSPLNPSEVFH